jgi:hypothetical protein
LGRSFLRPNRHHGRFTALARSSPGHIKPLRGSPVDQEVHPGDDDRGRISASPAMMTNDSAKIVERTSLFAADGILALRMAMTPRLQRREKLCSKVRGANLYHPAVGKCCTGRSANASRSLSLSRCRIRKLLGPHRHSVPATAIVMNSLDPVSSAQIVTGGLPRDWSLPAGQLWHG